MANGRMKGSATVFVDRDGKVRCITCGAVHPSPGTLNGTAVVVDSDAIEQQSVLDGTADQVGDDTAANALLNGTTVNVVDSDGTTVPVTILSDGTAVVVDSDGNAIPVIFDGTAFASEDSNANGASTDANGASTDGKGTSDGKGESGADGASYGAKAAKVFTISGCAVVGFVALPAAGLGALSLAGFTSAGPAAGSIAAAWMSSIAASNGGAVAAGSLYSLLQSTAMGGAGWLVGTTSAVGAAGGAATGGGLGSWVSSKLRRTTASSSSSGGCDPGSGCSDDQEKSMERCVTCGSPVAAANSRA